MKFPMWCVSSMTSPVSRPPPSSGSRRSMQVGQLLMQTARLIREHLFLPLLGALIVVFSGSELDRLTNLIYSSRHPNRFPPINGGLRELLRSCFLDAFAPARAVLQWIGARFGPAGLAGLIVGFLLLAIAAGVLILVVRGGIIASADEIAATGDSSFGAAMRAGWRRAWRLIIIASIPPIPVTVGAILVVIIVTLMLRQSRGVSLIDRPAEVWNALNGSPAVAIACLMLPLWLISFILGLLRHLADRACVLESKGAIASYRRGWYVFRQHVGDVLILLVIQLALEIAIWLVLLIPSALVTLCAVLLLPLWLVLGAKKAYFIALWTLAWRGWTASSPSHPELIDRR